MIKQKIIYPLLKHKIMKEKKENEHWGCFRLLKGVITNEDDMGAGSRIGLGLIGLVGTIIIDPVNLICDKLGFKSDEDNNDYDANKYTYP